MKRTLFLAIAILAMSTAARADDPPTLSDKLSDHDRVVYNLRACCNGSTPKDPMAIVTDHSKIPPGPHWVGDYNGTVPERR